MKMKDIKVGRWYETALGNGVVTRVGGTHPPSVAINIISPFPRGVCNLTAREFIREMDPPREDKPGEG